MSKTIGILGGMGPLATADLFLKIVEHTDAAVDQEHLHIVIDNDPSIPDRTAALLRGGEDPFPMMLRDAQGLEAMGAQVLLMPCVTGHSYLDALQRALNVPLLNMLTVTCDAMLRQGVRKAALFATTGTAQTGIYDRVCSGYGIELVKPSQAEQQVVMDLIYKGVKTGARRYDAAEVNAIAARLLDAGARTVILGCTELPIAYERFGLDFPHIDPTLELAKRAIEAAGGRVKE